MFGKRKENRIYLDNSASTAMDVRVFRAMEPYWSIHYGNAGSIHEEGRVAKEAVEKAREIVAKTIHAIPRQIIFTSGGTESNNLAILGSLHKYKERNEDRASVLTSAVEHKSVLDAVYTTKHDTDVHIIGTDTDGKVDIEALKEALSENTAIVSLIYVHNEIGTIQDITSVSHLLRKFRKNHDTGNYPLLHIDASQAPAWLTLTMSNLGVDLMTLDGQKVYGPKGVGCLYVRQNEMLTPLLFGGGQEKGLRPGTPPTPLIVGFARALEILEEERDTYVSNIREMRNWFFEYIEKHIPDVVINGPRNEERIAGNINLSFPGLDGEQLVIEMDEKGVAISTGSACLSEETGGSYVIKALHKNIEAEGGTIRLSLGRHTTKDELKKTAEKLVETVEWLREAH